jgi:hypothetical protein
LTARIVSAVLLIFVTFAITHWSNPNGSRSVPSADVTEVPNQSSPQPTPQMHPQSTPKRDQPPNPPGEHGWLWLSDIKMRGTEAININEDHTLPLDLTFTNGGSVEAQEVFTRALLAFSPRSKYEEKIKAFFSTSDKDYKSDHGRIRGNPLAPGEPRVVPILNDELYDVSSLAPEARQRMQIYLFVYLRWRDSKNGLRKREDCLYIPAFRDIMWASDLAFARWIGCDEKRDPRLGGGM